MLKIFFYIIIQYCDQYVFNPRYSFMGAAFAL